MGKPPDQLPTDGDRDEQRIWDKAWKYSEAWKSFNNKQLTVSPCTISELLTWYFLAKQISCRHKASRKGTHVISDSEK